MIAEQRFLFGIKQVLFQHLLRSRIENKALVLRMWFTGIEGSDQKVVHMGSRLDRAMGYQAGETEGLRTRNASKHWGSRIFKMLMQIVR
jgi:hypothetical protein